MKIADTEHLGDSKRVAIKVLVGGELQIQGKSHVCQQSNVTTKPNLTHQQKLRRN